MSSSNVDKHSNQRSRYAFAGGLVAVGMGLSLYGWWASRPEARFFFEKMSLTRLFYNLNETYGIAGVHTALRANALFLIPGLMAIALGAMIALGKINRENKSIELSNKLSVGALCALWAATYLPLLSSVKMGGDACMYAIWIKNATPGAMSLHWGIMVLGMIWNAIMPLQIDVGLNIFGCLMGLGGGLIAFYFVKKYTSDPIFSLMAALMLLWCPNLWFHSVLYKSYSSEMFFVFLSYLLWTKDRPISAGFSFLVAMLITPLAVLAAPGFILGKISIRKILLFAASSLPLFIIFLFYYRHDYFYGRFGLFTQGNIVSNITFLSNLPGSLKLLALNLNVAIPFIIVGAIACLKKEAVESGRLLIAAALGFISLVILQGKWVEFASEILFFIFPAIFFGIAFSKIGSIGIVKNDFRPVEKAVAFATLIALFGVIGFVRMFPEYMARRNFRDVSLEVRAKMEPGAVVLGHWERIRQFEYYTTGDLWTNLVFSYQGVESEWKKMDEKNRPPLDRMVAESLGDYHQVWIIESNVAESMGKVAKLETVELPSGRVWKWNK